MKLSSFKQMGVRLAQARTAAHLSQETLAERVGISPGHLSKLERGVAAVSLADLNRICEALSAEPDWILFGQQAPATPDQLARLERLVRQCDPRTLSIMLDACERLAQIENEK